MGSRPDPPGEPAPSAFAGDLVQAHPKGCVLRVRVAPKARRLAIVGVLGDALKVSLTAAAERGDANRQLQEFLAETLQLPRHRVVVDAGLASRTKLVLLVGVDRRWLVERLEAVLSWRQ